MLVCIMKNLWNIWNLFEADLWIWDTFCDNYSHGTLDSVLDAIKSDVNIVYFMVNDEIYKTTLQICMNLDLVAQLHEWHWHVQGVYFINCLRNTRAWFIENWHIFCCKDLFIILCIWIKKSTFTGQRKRWRECYPNSYLFIWLRDRCR